MACLPSTLPSTLLSTLLVLCVSSLACTHAQLPAHHRDLFHNLQQSVQLQRVAAGDVVDEGITQILQLSARGVSGWDVVQEGIKEIARWTIKTTPQLDKCINDTLCVGCSEQDSLMWALQALDATGKLGSGILEGNRQFPGSFPQCLNVRINSNGTSFKGQYAMMTLTLPPVQNIPLSFMIGLCVASSCDKDHLNTIISLGVNAINILPIANITAEITNYHPQSKTLDPAAIGVTFMLSVIGLVLVVATLYDVLKRAGLLEEKPQSSEGHTGKSYELSHISNGQIDHLPHPADEQPPAPPTPGTLHRVLIGFSVVHNTEKMLSDSPPYMACLHGLRFLSMMWVILGHVMSINILTFSKNPKMYIDMYGDFLFQAIGNAFYAVDSFFLLSGILVCYALMAQLTKCKGPSKVNWPLVYFHRFWRLTPTYMIVLGTMTALFAYIGDGPFWPHEKGLTPICKKYWWTNLLYINNLPLSADRQLNDCMDWSWYLANDMQFFIVAPIIVIAFYFRWWIGTAVCVAITIASMVCRGWETHVSGLSIQQSYYYQPPEINLDWYYGLYIQPHYRMGPYAIGMIVGYLIFVTKDKRVKIPKLAVVLGWTVASVVGAACVYGGWQDAKGNKSSMEVALAYNTATKAAWSLCVAWVCFTCCHGYGGPVGRLLSWPALFPFSRLTYCAYLVHPAVQVYVAYSMHDYLLATETVVVTVYLSTLVMSFMLAYVTSLAFEAPFMALEKVMFGRK